MNDPPFQLSKRPQDGHKGTFGRVLAIAGSRGMSGAAVLCGRAALRGGAGLVSVAVPESVLDVVASLEPCFTTIPLEVRADGLLSEVPQAALDLLLDNRDVVAIGPGLGQSDGASSLVSEVFIRASCPLVLDADALNIAAHLQLLSLERRCSEVVLTPHPGEFSRLAGLSVPEIEANRSEHAKRFAADHGVVVVLKGHKTIVTDGQQVYVNSTGNSGMATGGSGDVLTGILSAQIAQGLQAFEAAVLAVFVHGIAGDLAAAAHSERGLIATDLPDFLGKAWLHLEDKAGHS